MADATEPTASADTESKTPASVVESTELENKPQTAEITSTSMVDAAEPTASVETESKPPASAAESTEPENKSQTVEIKRWADVVDDEEQPSGTASSSEDKIAEELKVDKLTIDDAQKINKFLDDPEDSRIQAVRFLCLLLGFCRTMEIGRM